MICPCGTSLDYTKCCEPYIAGKGFAPSPEALMRSRYSAYAVGAVKYLGETLAPEFRKDYDENETRNWAEKSEWLGLKILKAKDDTVEFIAKYKAEGKVLEHHEVSTFRKLDNRWYFVDGESHVHEEGAEHCAEPKAPVVRATPKLGRNDPCHCGSGKKLKKCHGES